MTVGLSKFRSNIINRRLAQLEGRVVEIVGLLVKAQGIALPVGETCLVKNRNGDIPAEVIGFNEDRHTLLMVLGNMEGISPGDRVIATGKSPTVRVGNGILGRVIDSMGNPLDDKGELDWSNEYPIYQEPPPALSRMPVDSVLPTGIRAIDGLLTVGRGQRVGIYGGAGVGKSILMGMIARNTEADINVIALIGERGREVGNFVRSVLGEEGLKRSVVVAATSDQPALMRIRGAFVAMAVAEYFRDQGKSVMLMMDSVTRMAMAQREVGMTVGEPPTTRGYTPSVFSMLPKLMERAGTSDQQGSITGFYTVLVEGDDMMEPITDATRAILDGHIVLSRELASQGHYPAIDILESISRLMVDIVPKAHQNVADALRELLAIYRENQTLINIGLYRKGTNPDIDIAIDYRNEILNFLRQEMMEKVEYEDLLTHLYEIFPDIANEENVANEEI
ncbi:TPA: FliI/YscN family ATPase [Candidatus Poribacteria bacterium]|nr:FliI/YscN family ATPase [Candidatus Poribacteria bacterium]HIO50809.1 FliI/YscN family ATPase [Candidatus Poribacteria bacterium]